MSVVRRDALDREMDKVLGRRHEHVWHPGPLLEAEYTYGGDLANPLSVLLACACGALRRKAIPERVSR